MSIQKNITVQAYCFDSSSTPVPLENVEVRIFLFHDGSFGDPLDSGYSDEAGCVELTVPSNDKYMIARVGDGYYFDLEDATITDASGQTFSSYGILFEQPPLPDSEICVVYGFIRDITADITETPTLTVKIWSGSTVYTATGQEVLAHPKIVYIDSATGYWEVGLIPNELLTPEWNQYRFEFSWRGKETNPRIYSYRKFVTIPNQDAVDFVDL